MPTANEPGTRPPGEPKADELLDEARKRYDRAWQVDQNNREAGISDLEFTAGEQWPQDVQQEYAGENRTIVTINRMPQFVRRVTGQFRNNRPSIRVRPVDGKADKHTADVYSGLIRHIESVSSSKIAYQKAMDSSTAGNMGWLRVLNKYTDDYSFDQDLIIEPIYDGHSVYCDPLAKHPTRMDAMWLFVTEEVPEDEYQDRFPQAKAGPSEWQRVEGQDDGRYWYSDNTITVAEYWVKRPYEAHLGLMASGQVVDLTGQGRPFIEFLKSQGNSVIANGEEVVDRLVKERKAKAHRIVRYKLSGAEILEGAEEWPGTYIPLVAVPGDEIHIGKRTVRRSLIHDAKDAQRLYNYAVSTGTDVYALQPKAPFILTAEQVQGREKMWSQAGKRNYPYLVANYVPGQPWPPTRAQPPVASDGVISLIQQAGEDMKATTGIYDAALGAKSNETAGVAIAERQEEADVGTSVFPDNLTFAVEQIGRILVELIPVFYSEREVVRILNEDDSEKQVAINQVFKDEKTGQDRLIRFDIGRYDVMVSTGPTYATRRQEAAESMLAFVQAAPQFAQFVMDLIAKSSDWPGADEIADRLRKIIEMQAPGLIEPEEGQQPSMQEVIMQMQQQMQQIVEQIMQAPEFRKAEAEADKADAEAEGKRIENTQAAFDLFTQSGQFQELVQQAVADALAGGFEAGQMASAQPGMMPQQ